MRRSLLVSSTAGDLPTAPITNTLSPVKSNIFWASSNHSSEPNSDRLNWRASPEPALPVEVAPPLLGRLDAGQLAAVVGQLASAALDQPARLFPLVVAAGHVEVAVQADAAGAGAVVDPVPELGDGVDAAGLQHELVGVLVVAPGGVVHQPRRHAQVDLRPLGASRYGSNRLDAAAFASDDPQAVIGELQQMCVLARAGVKNGGNALLIKREGAGGGRSASPRIHEFPLEYPYSLRA